MEIYDEDITVASFTDKLSLINSKSAETGVTASFFEQTFTIDPSKLTVEDVYEINGHDVTLAAATIATLFPKLTG